MTSIFHTLLAGIAGLSVAGPALTMPLESLYPPEEHCIFVPPPAWDLIVVLDKQQACMLEADRNLALVAAEDLVSRREWMIQTLTPDQGFTSSFLEEGGPLLQLQVRRNFENFLAFWRTMRRDETAPGMLELVRKFRNACERGALLAVWRDEKGQANAGVISLITGNVLADGPIDTGGASLGSC